MTPLVERPLMARMSITCRNVYWCAVTTITDCHLIQRVIPLTLIGKTDDRLAIRAPIASCDNASRNDRAHAPSRQPHDRNQLGAGTHVPGRRRRIGRSILPTKASPSRGRMASYEGRHRRGLRGTLQGGPVRTR